MELYDAIVGRECTPTFRKDEVASSIIERVLEAGTWAPNRFLTEPWRFWVLTGDGRRPLSNILVEIEKDNMVDPHTEANQKKLRSREEQPFSAPVVIIVGCEISEKPRVVPIEEIEAVSACIQNILLALHAEGLEGYWKTPASIYDSKFKEFLGLKEKDHVLGLLYAGYPASHKTERKRASCSHKTKWISEDISYKL